jgi:nucleotide-binding universal stress UspA family protein
MAQTFDSHMFTRPATAADYANVLVPLDGSRLAETALGPARRLAARFRAELHTVTVGVRRDERWWYLQYLDRLRADGRADGLATHLSDNRRAPEGILAMAQDLAPSLLCMATHGRARSAALVGSTFAHVVASLDQPVLAVGPGFVPDPRSPHPGRLVACLDGGPRAEQALPIVAAWARRLGVPVTLLSAADPLRVLGWKGRDRARVTKLYAPTGDPDEYFAVLAGLPLFDGLDVDCSVVWDPAEPATAIGERLERDPATIAGAVTHARTGLSRAVVGSTVARLLHRSRVPLLVVPAQPVP